MLSVHIVGTVSCSAVDLHPGLFVDCQLCCWPVKDFDLVRLGFQVQLDFKRLQSKSA